MRTTIYTAIFQSPAREVSSRLGADSPHEAAKLARLRLDPQVVEPAAFELLAVRLDGAGPGGADAVWHYVGDCAACPPGERRAVFASDGGTLAPDGAVFCASCSAKLRAHVEGEAHPEPLLVGGDLEAAGASHEDDEEMFAAAAEHEQEQAERAHRAVDVLRRLVLAPEDAGLPIDIPRLVEEARELLAGISS